MSTPTRSEFVGGKVDDAINEAIGDIWPGAHVIVTWYDANTETWTFELGTTPVPAVEAVEGAELSAIIAAAEDSVRIAKLKLLKAWGIDTSDIEGVPA